MHAVAGAAAAPSSRRRDLTTLLLADLALDDPCPARGGHNARVFFLLILSKADIGVCSWTKKKREASFIPRWTPQAATTHSHAAVDAPPRWDKTGVRARLQARQGMKRELRERKCDGED